MKNRSLFGLAAVGVVLCTSWSWAQTKRTSGRIISVMPEVATEGLTPAQNLQIQGDVSQWLTDQRSDGLQSIRVQIAPAEMESIEMPEPVNAAPLKVGVVVPMDQQVAIRGFGSLRDAGGQLTQARDGSYSWAIKVGSEGAGGVRIHVVDLFLPDSASLYFYSEYGEAYGPYFGTGPDGTGEFWTPSVLGQDGILQIRLEPGATKDDKASVSLTITEVGHIARSFFGIAEEGAVAAFCQFNASCIVNNNCTSNNAVADAEKAVAKMLWVQGAFIYTCSGGLIADTDAGSQIPYFMTANHCRSSSSSNLEAFFQYEVSCGTSNCTGTYTDPPTNLIAGKTVGATIKATGAISSGDFSLFQLNQNPPAGSVFLGWNNAPIAFTSGVALHRVSHPSGAPQAYSNATVNTSAQTCQGWNRGPLIYSTGGVGGIEGGSSGSPVVNSSGQFVGQLTGSCGTNINNVCDHNSNRTVDGALAHYFSAVDDFLDAGGGCVPTAEICNDGVDNDCDGNTDCQDSDCSGDPACSGGGCAPLGASCTVNADCCSNKCKGPAGNKTCK